MFRLITIEREYGCGAAAIAAQLADRLGWKLWDQLLTQEIARLASVDPSAVRRCDERMDSRLHRLAKSFWRGSYERNSAALGSQMFDTDRMMPMMQEIMNKIAQEGNAVIVGRGAPYLLRENPDAFHVFLYAPRSEKIRRSYGGGAQRRRCRGTGRLRRSRAHRLREALLQCRLAHAFALPPDAQYGSGKRAGGADDSGHDASCRGPPQSHDLRASQHARSSQ